MKKQSDRILGLILACFLCSGTVLSVQAEEVTHAWDEETRIDTLRRKVVSAVNVYTDGKAEDITHEEGILEDVYYDILRVNPSEHTHVQIDYCETPQYLDELADMETLDRGYLYAGGINGGYFSMEEGNYGQPVGAVRRNNEWTCWGPIKNTPAYGNGFATAYITDGQMKLRYHGWAWGQWNGDDLWHWSSGYRINEDYAISGSYTYFADGRQQDITGGAYGDINYRTYGRALTILAQKADRQFLLITIYGTLGEETVLSFLTDLKVHDAIRMDGGGSTQMVYESSLVKETEPELADTAFSEPLAEEEDPIGMVSVHVDKLRVRSAPRTTGTARGYAENGERYRVFETENDGTYTWYRIGRNRWIAGTDEWVEYETAEEVRARSDAQKELQVTVNVDHLNIRSRPSISASLKGQAVKGHTYTAMEEKTAYGYTWYRIGEDSWIAGTDEWVSVKD